VTIVLLAARSVGCRGTTRVRCVGSDLLAPINYSYSGFTGRESGTLQGGVAQRIAQSYEVSVSSGILSIKMQEPQG